jgi:hypothetical protein
MTQPEKSSSTIQHIEVPIQSGPVRENDRFVFKLNTTLHQTIGFSIPDTLQDFYQRGEEITDLQIIFSPGFPDSLIGKLEIGGGKVDGQTWYLTWSFTKDLWERCLLSDTIVRDERSYKLETKAYYGYRLDVIGPGPEAGNKLFVNGKLVEATYMPIVNLWKTETAYSPSPSLFDVAERLIKCCPVVIFQK